MCLKSLCPRFCSSKQSFKQSSQVQKSTGVTCDPLFIRTQQQQCHVRHSHCDIIRKKQAVTELFQLLTKKKSFFFTLFLSTSAKFNQFCNFRFVHSPQIFNQLFYEKKANRSAPFGPSRLGKIGPILILSFCAFA